MATTIAPEHIRPVDVAVAKQEEVQERRRVERTEGQRLLFAGAQDAARQQGKLEEGLFASFDHSSLGRSSYALKTSTGQLLARVPLAEARDMLSFRRQLARQVLGKLKVEIMKESSTKVERRQIRLQDDQIRALAWAIGEGRRFPYQGSETKQTLITLALLLCCVVPGLVYYVVRVLRPRQEYEQELKKLEMRWRTLGKPDPPASFFALYDL
jgi:hypothetical protein